MIYIMIIIVSSAQFFPFLLTTLTTDTIILIFLTKIVIFMLSKGVVRLWGNPECQDEYKRQK